MAEEAGKAEAKRGSGHGAEGSRRTASGFLPKQILPNRYSAKSAHWLLSSLLRKVFSK